MAFGRCSLIFHFLDTHSMKTLFSFPALAVAALCVLSASRTPSVFAGEVVLENDKLLAAFDSDSGALTRLENKTTHWEVEQNPKLGASFRLTFFVPSGQGDVVSGQKQH